jgi:hypothetical protein
MRPYRCIGSGEAHDPFSARGVCRGPVQSKSRLEAENIFLRHRLSMACRFCRQCRHEMSETVAGWHLFRTCIAELSWTIHNVFVTLQ